MGGVRRAFLAAGLASGLSIACEDPLPPPTAPVDAGPADTGPEPKDAEVLEPSTLERGQLYPEVEEAASSGGTTLRGRLGAHGVQTSSAGRYRLRGGFRPLTR